MSFYMEHNAALEKMNTGECAIGIQLRSNSERIAEMLGYMGFDFLYIETEHFAGTDESIERLARCAQLSGMTTWVRVIQSDAESLGHIMDLGVQGIIIPHLETAEQAAAFVDAIKFPPQGHRGASSSSRAGAYDLMSSKHFMECSNRNCSAIGMIESLKGVENLEAILDSGLDMIRVGRSDLSMDMGLYGKQSDPRFVEILRHITETAHKKGVKVGTGAKNPENALYFRELGFDFFTLMSDLDFLKSYMPPLLKEVRGALKHEEMI